MANLHVPVDVIAAAIGAFVNPDPRYLQSTGFVLDPGGRVIVSVYSSGAIGRLVPQDAMGLVRYLREHATPSQSRFAVARSSSGRSRRWRNGQCVSSRRAANSPAKSSPHGPHARK
jgi:hypothetical protein